MTTKAKDKEPKNPIPPPAEEPEVTDKPEGENKPSDPPHTTLQHQMKITKVETAEIPPAGEFPLQFIVAAKSLQDPSFDFREKKWHYPPNDMFLVECTEGWRAKDLVEQISKAMREIRR